MEKYIGIENEVISFKKGRKVSFGSYFKRFRKPSDFQRIKGALGIRGKTTITTKNGLGFYVDGKELEILTPPVALNKGFSTRLTDLLMIGRDRVVKSIPELEHTGYSMHWNITKGKPSHDTFYEGIAVPFQLFCLTPLSKGFRLRDKEENQKILGRYEILGDSLTNEEQIRATALLMGAYSYALESAGSNPLRIAYYGFKTDDATRLFLPNGRYDKVNIISPEFQGEIQVQQYLELFYQWAEPFVKALGTKEEVQNLEDFISGRKKLEFDKFKYFAYLHDMEGKYKGEYQPIKTKDPDNPGQILKLSNKKRNLPLEGMLLGTLVRKKKRKIEGLSWERLWLEDELVRGIGRIYKYASSLDKNLPKFKNAMPLCLTPNDIKKITLKPDITYNPNEDEFKDPRTSFLKYSLERVKNGARPIALKLLLLAAVGFVSFSVASWIYQRYDSQREAKSIMQEYKVDEKKEKKVLNLGRDWIEIIQRDFEVK